MRRLSLQGLQGVQPEFAVNILSLRPENERFRASAFWALLRNTLLLPKKSDAIAYRKFVTQVRLAFKRHCEEQSLSKLN